MDDHRLLREYVADRSQPAFAALTRKYVNLVYSSALRQVHDRHLAEDVTQAVFLILSQKAATIRESVPLSGWLHNATRYAAADARRARTRRLRMEQKVAKMHEDNSKSIPTDDWTAVAPLLDEAVARLPTRDRQAILLRYFEGLPLADVGAVLSISPDAARMRLERAVLRMRGFFRRKGIHVSASAIAPMLATHATDSAPPDLTASVAQPQALAPTIATLARSATRILFWNQVRQVTAAVLLFAMAASGATVVVNTLHPASFFFTPAPDPISATNQYFRAAFAGNIPALRALVHTRSSLEADRTEAFFQMYQSLAHFRTVCDSAFDSGALRNTGFRGFSFDYKVPVEAPLQVDRDGNTLVPIHLTYMPVREIDHLWKIDESALWILRCEVMTASGNEPLNPNSPEVAVRVQHFQQLFDRLSSEVESGSLATVADVFQSIDTAMNGRAAKLPVVYAPIVMDITSPSVGVVKFSKVSSP